LVSAQVPVRSLGDLAALASLRSARPMLAMTNALPVPAVSQGDVSLNGPAAREAAGVDGSGITVGTLSDSFNCNPAAFLPGAPTSTFAEDLSNDELPTDTTILDNGPCSNDSTDEGRGMAQLIHDVAPGAAISFHTAFNSEFDFAEGIIELADAGANVIVDDVGYFAEPFFSDGMIAQAVDIVAERGVPYYSSAGNGARDSYESEFRGINILVNAGKNLNGGKAVVRRFHNFGTTQAPSILQPVFLQPTAEAGFTIFSFQWDQPHLTATTYAQLKAEGDPSDAIGAESDLDLVFFDYKGHVVPLCPPGVARGITCQFTGDRNIGGDAVDISALFYSGPPKVAQLFFIGIVHNAGPDPGVVKHIWFDFQGVFGLLDFDTQSGTSWGHSNAAGVQSVGAASWYVTEPFSTSGEVPPNDIHFANLPPPQNVPIDLSPCDPACLNDFSSAGGIPIYFDRFGNRLAEPEVRLVPSVTGPDGGNTSFFFTDSSYDDDDGDGKNSSFSTFISGGDLPGDEYPNFFGTSASAPHVAAVAALMLEKDPSLTVEEIREILQETARPISLRFTSARPTVTFPIDDIEPSGYSFDAGFGLVDAAAALEAIGP
jgi:subtilisin family serine protease